jgi:hypothetical protein
VEVEQVAALRLAVNCWAKESTCMAVWQETPPLQGLAQPSMLRVLHAECERAGHSQVVAMSLVSNAGSSHARTNQPST